MSSRQLCPPPYLSAHEYLSQPSSRAAALAKEVRFPSLDRERTIWRCRPNDQRRTPSIYYFKEMGKFAKPDAHLYEVCYVLDKTSR
jgi:hypothetical protein